MQIPILYTSPASFDLTIKDNEHPNAICDHCKLPIFGTRYFQLIILNKKLLGGFVLIANLTYVQNVKKCISTL
jgi:hypothetical protein